MDTVLKNIRRVLISNRLKLKTCTVEMIDQIYRFEYLNDLSRNTTLERMICEQLDRVNYVDPYDWSKAAKKKRRKP